MSWFNYIGTVIVAMLMLPNIVFAIRHKDDFVGAYRNKCAEIFEQIGRYGCMVTMIFNVPYTYFGFWFHKAIYVYILVNALLCASYLLCWAAFRKRTDMARALSLSILPSAIFLFGGIMLSSIPLTAFAVLFASCHILISGKNAR